MTGSDRAEPERLLTFATSIYEAVGMSSQDARV